MDSGRRGFDWTRSATELDERSAREDNLRPCNGKRAVVLHERCIASEETFMVLEE